MHEKNPNSFFSFHHSSITTTTICSLRSALDDKKSQKSIHFNLTEVFWLECMLSFLSQRYPNNDMWSQFLRIKDWPQKNEIQILTKNYLFRIHQLRIFSHHSNVKCDPSGRYLTFILLAWYLYVPLSFYQSCIYIGISLPTFTINLVFISITISPFQHITISSSYHLTHLTFFSSDARAEAKSAVLLWQHQHDGIQSKSNIHVT